MECDRLIRLIKNWYVQVQDEALAPARMVFLMEKHIVDCPICQEDPVVRLEVNKVIKIVLPETKLPKIIRPAPEEDSKAKKKQDEEINEDCDDDEEEEKYASDDDGDDPDEIDDDLIAKN